MSDHHEETNDRRLAHRRAGLTGTNEASHSPSNDMTVRGLKSDQEPKSCKRRKCPMGQIAVGQKCQKCPSGMQPNPWQEKCVPPYCTSPDQALIGGECQKCPDGQKPNALRDRCQRSKLECDKMTEVLRKSKCVPKHEYRDDKSNCPIGKSSKNDGSCGDEPPKETAEEDKDKQKEEERKKEEEKKKKEEEAKKKVKNQKISRVAKCVQLVSLALSVSEAEDLANDFFTEDILASAAVEEFWIDGISLDTSIDDRLDNDELPSKWAASLTRVPEFHPGGAGLEIFKRGESSALARSEVELEEADEKFQLHKRFISALLAGILRIGWVIAGALTRAGGALARMVKDGFKVAARGKGRKTEKEQLNVVRDKISKNRNWERCLKGEMLFDVNRTE